MTPPAGPPEPSLVARRPVFVHVLVAVASLGLVSAGFHPVDWPALAWIAFVPWMSFHASGPRPGTARALAAAYFLHFAAVLSWTAEVTIAGPLLIPLLGMPFVIAMGKAFDVLVHRRGLRPLLVYPLGIVAAEVLRDQALGLTWSSIGYTQWRWIEGLQSAAVFRVHALSFVILLVNAALAEFLVAVVRRMPRRRAAIGLATALAAVAVVHGIGALRLAKVEFRAGPRAVGVQPNIPQWQKDRKGLWQKNFARHQELLPAARLRGLDPDLVVFTETSMPPVGGTFADLDEALDAALGFGEDGRLVGWRSLLPRGRGQVSVLGYARHRPIEAGGGVLDDDGDGFQEWNVAAVVRDAATLVTETEKEIIVPFGEYIPWPASWPFREQLKRAILATGGFVPDLTRGASREVVSFDASAGRFSFGCHICYEVVFPEITRDLVRRGADFVVNISNDGWFRESSELDLVNVALVFRAVEVGRSLFRASNTGISTLVDPSGRVRAVVEAGGRRKSVAGLLVGEIPIGQASTPWTRFGDLLPGLFVPAFLGLFLRIRRKAPGRPAPGLAPTP